MKTPNNLILGAAVGYRWPQMAPFIRSLRRTGCRAEVVLLVGRTDRETRQALNDHAIIPLSVHPIASHLPPPLSRKRFNRRWLGWLHRILPKLIGVSPDPASARNVLLARAASCFHHPACSRYFAYYRYLRPRVDRFSSVLTTDVRDVIFQADPFAETPPHGSVFLEHDAVHGREPGNDLWVEIGFGSEGLARLKDRRVLCSGLTLAPAKLMLNYLAAMSRELARRTASLTGLDGVDQGVHNWLFWTDQLPGFSTVENFRGPILTMHGLPAEWIATDTDGRVVFPNQRVIPILHQYDRHAEIAAGLLGKFQQSTPS